MGHTTAPAITHLTPKGPATVPGIPEDAERRLSPGKKRGARA